MYIKKYDKNRQKKYILTIWVIEMSHCFISVPFDIIMQVIHI